MRDRFRDEWSVGAQAGGRAVLAIDTGRGRQCVGHRAEHTLGNVEGQCLGAGGRHRLAEHHAVLTAAAGLRLVHSGAEHERGLGAHGIQGGQGHNGVAGRHRRQVREGLCIRGGRHHRWSYVGWSCCHWRQVVGCKQQEEDKFWWSKKVLLWGEKRDYFQQKLITNTVKLTVAPKFQLSEQVLSNLRESTLEFSFGHHTQSRAIDVEGVSVISWQVILFETPGCPLLNFHDCPSVGICNEWNERSPDVWHSKNNLGAVRKIWSCHQKDLPFHFLSPKRTKETRLNASEWKGRVCGKPWMSVAHFLWNSENWWAVTLFVKNKISEKMVEIIIHCCRCMSAFQTFLALFNWPKVAIGLVLGHSIFMSQSTVAPMFSEFGSHALATVLLTALLTVYFSTHCVRVRNLPAGIPSSWQTLSTSRRASSISESCDTATGMTVRVVASREGIGLSLRGRFICFCSSMMLGFCSVGMSSYKVSSSWKPKGCSSSKPLYASPRGALSIPRGAGCEYAWCSSVLLMSDNRVSKSGRAGLMSSTRPESTLYPPCGT